MRPSKTPTITLRIPLGKVLPLDQVDINLPSITIHLPPTEGLDHDYTLKFNQAKFNPIQTPDGVVLLTYEYGPMSPHFLKQYTRFGQIYKALISRPVTNAPMTLPLELSSSNNDINDYLSNHFDITTVSGELTDIMDLQLDLYINTALQD